MKATMHYLMMILFFVSLLIGQPSCAHTPQRPVDPALYFSPIRISAINDDLWQLVAMRGGK